MTLDSMVQEKQKTKTKKKPWLEWYMGMNIELLQ